ncbi:glycoside hydrolase family 125 protein [Antribacter sp. KLBMP9083]|uniref:Glycoside hydrolase family 125 protein n=1 Tax=Antribacter soli TaxID=2910976 RepID=A0AA41QD73_9MICO|nr:glycoside hydrolase family 125 protein [Antribacter soli]MCF4121294.1 glycoside hydrolase family 125 protein [Antribacter soli]
MTDSDFPVPPAPAGPPPDDGWTRKVLTDDVVEAWTERVRTALPGTEVPRVFRACLARTIRRSLMRLDSGEVAVITGDIPAMWLRDSSTQMWPYLTLVASDPRGPLADVLVGVALRQLALIVHDPYANAFNLRPDGRAHNPDDEWGEHPADQLIWERKYEVDSLCFPLQLATRLFEVTGRREVLGPALQAAQVVVRTLRTEQDHERFSPYRFVRPGGNALDTLPRGGRGGPVAVTGMTWSGFRPSDDACTYGYNVPANLHAAAVLDDIGALVTAASEESGPALAAEARVLADELRAGVERYGVVVHPVHGEIYAYEVDGLGAHLLMDDANLPSLLSLPLITNVRQDDARYMRTRRFVLSPENPTFTQGTALGGVGSPHTWPGWVWPIAVATEGLTTQNRSRRVEALRTLAATTAGTDHMHESVNAGDPTRFTRPWFSWADSMFCLLALATAAPDRYVPPAAPRAEPA